MSRQNAVVEGLNRIGIKAPRSAGTIYVWSPIPDKYTSSMDFAKDVLTKTTVNRYLKRWGYDRETLGRPPPAVRFQATQSNECWHFDLSPSDLKRVEKPEWFEEGRGHPLLMLYSVVDDRSGVCY